MGKLTSLLKERRVKNIGFPPLFQVWLWLSLHTHDRLRVFHPIQQGQGCWVHNKRWYVWKDLVCHMINDMTLQVNNARLLILLSKTTRNIFLQVMWALYVDAGDRPLVVQFAASNAKDFADATELVAPFADGVDLNCGCPQRYTGDPRVEFICTGLVFKPQKRNPILQYSCLFSRPLVACNTALLFYKGQKAWEWG